MISELQNWTMEVTVGENTVAIDVVDAKLMTERNAEREPSAKLACMQEWMQQTYGVAISPSQAWQLWQYVEEQFEALKKTFDDTLALRFGTESTHSASTDTN